MTKISGNKFVALCESNVSEITVNQSVSQDEILSDRDDLGEEEGSILPEYGEGNDAKGKEEMKEVCEDKSNTGVDKTNENLKIDVKCLWTYWKKIGEICHIQI